jgi:hypothetical protein
MESCIIKRFKHLVIFECDGVERTRLLFCETPYMDSEQASEILTRDFGFKNCKIFQIDCLTLK